MRLAGKVAFVSAARAAWELPKPGCSPERGLMWRSATCWTRRGERWRPRINEMGGRALYVHLDVTRPESWQAAMDATIEAFGRLDVLVNNAGVLVDGTRDDHHRELGPRHGREREGRFPGRDGGHSSHESRGRRVDYQHILHFGDNRPGAHPRRIQRLQGRGEAAHKSIAIQYAKEGIRVNSVHPGGVETPMTAAGRADPERYARTIASTPLGRYAAQRHRLRRALPRVRTSRLT